MRVETRSSVESRPKRALHQQYFPWPQRDRQPGLLPEEGLYDGEPETCRRSLRSFLRNFIYLALLLAVFKVYRIEERAFQGRAFQMLVTLALVALPVHYMAPFRWKKPLFVAISILGLFCVSGADCRDRARSGDNLDRNLFPPHPMDRQGHFDGRSGPGPGRGPVGVV